MRMIYRLKITYSYKSTSAQILASRAVKTLK